MLRLLGLPSPVRYPDVDVRHLEGAIVLSFLPAAAGGPRPAGDVVRVDVDLGLLGPGADAEREELELLGRLRAAGYRVRRVPGAGPPA